MTAIKCRACGKKIRISKEIKDMSETDWICEDCWDKRIVVK